MASNSSSVFNGAPTEAKPTNTTATAPDSPLLSSTQSSSTSADACPVSSISTLSTTVVTVAESGKRIAPQMEPAVDDLGSNVRFARVSPESDMKPLVRKSCLKRSMSSLPVTLSVVPCEPMKTAEAQSLEGEKPTVSDVPLQKNRRRCWECKAKVGLTAVTCRCDYTFCNKHRYAEEHNCRFNFRGAAKRKLEEENPRIVPLKVARIN